MLIFHCQHNVVIVFVNNSRKLLERQYLFFYLSTLILLADLQTRCIQHVLVLA